MRTDTELGEETGFIIRLKAQDRGDADIRHGLPCIVPTLEARTPPLRQTHVGVTAQVRAV